MKENLYPRQGLALVGLRGTGKSSVGRILADRLGRPFADADVELEAATGRSIPSIFQEFGEPWFRDWEERVLGELTARPNLILATGGGVVLRESNRQRLREFGFVVWLTAEPSLLADRLTSNPKALANRPALTAAGTIAELADVLRARAGFYREVANLVVETGGRTTRQVAEEILAGWRLTMGPAGSDRG
jgi:shikimate kinase